MKSHLGTAAVGFFGVIALLFAILIASYGSATPDVLRMLGMRASLLLTGSTSFDGLGGGFSANIGISIVAMLISSVLGFMLGAAMISRNSYVSGFSILLMNLMRNSPWLVILYGMLYLIPFRINIAGHEIWVSPAVKAIVGLSIPVTAYMAEVFRNGIQAIPAGQWESGLALGYQRGKILRTIILPQAIPEMVPNIMTTFAMLFIGSSLIVVTGTEDVLALTKVVISSDGDQYATGVYLFVLLIFFIFCYPIAFFSRMVEQIFQRNR